MKTRSLRVLLATFGCFALGSAALSAAPAKEAAKKARPALTKGMSAEEVRGIVGQPTEVEAIKTDEGKAEKWTYRREVDHTVIQTANTERTIPAFTGHNADGPVIGTAIVPDYRLKHVYTYQVTSLLMFEGRLVVAKQWLEREESFAD